MGETEGGYGWRLTSATYLGLGLTRRLASGRPTLLDNMIYWDAVEARCHIYHCPTDTRLITGCAVRQFWVVMESRDGGCKKHVDAR